MPNTQVAPDATLADLYAAGSLELPLHRIPVVLAVMRASRAVRRGAFLRIGVLGGGQRPSWRVEYGPDPDAAPRIYDKALGWHAQDLNGPVQADTWSTKRMTLAEVEALLARAVADDTQRQAAAAVA